MLKIKLLDEKCKPYRAHETDSGLDIRAREAIEIRPLETKVIPTGIAIEPQYKDVEGQIRPRSSLSEQGIITAFGTIDNGYRGEIKVTITNASGKTVVIQQYERIAQLVMVPIAIIETKYVEELSQTERGTNGHGSTGRI